MFYFPTNAAPPVSLETNSIVCCLLTAITSFLYFTDRTQEDSNQAETKDEASPEDTDQGATPGNRKLSHSFSSY